MENEPQRYNIHYLNKFSAEAVLFLTYVEQFLLLSGTFSLLFAESSIDRIGLSYLIGGTGLVIGHKIRGRIIEESFKNGYDIVARGERLK